MLLNDCGCGCGCAGAPVTPATTDRCRATLESTSIAQLLWIQGLTDVNGALCERFQLVADVLGLRDCNNNIISQTTPIVTCAAFKDKLCAVIAGLIPGGEAIVESTLLVGADCKLYTLPPGGGTGSETPNTATDTNSIDMSASGTLGRNISGTVKISTDAFNIVSIHSDGLYVPAPDAVLTTCQQISNFGNGADLAPGMQVIGSDCLKHTVPAPEAFTVTDTDSIDLTLTGNNLSADLILDPDFIGRITGSGLELTCNDVLTCAPAVTVNDSNSINLNLIGQQITADLTVDPNAGNDVVVLASGVRVSICDKLAVAVLAGAAIPGTTKLIGSDCFAYTLPTTDNTTVSDTLTIDLNLIGSDISGNVNIDPTGLVSTTGAGINVACDDVQDCVFGISNNFWTYSDVGNTVFFAPSTDVGNQITVGTDNKPYVPGLVLIADDTACIDLTLIGDTLTADIIISPNADNAITCIGNGLFAITAPDVTITDGTPNSCIQIVVSEPTPDNWEIGATPIISPDSPNALECRANGLFVDATAPAASFTFTSAIAVSHNIVHNLGNAFPVITVWNTATNTIVVPAAVTSNSINDLTITFFVATAIAGTIWG